MMRFLISGAIFLGSAALGLLVAALLVLPFHLHWAGFFVAIIIFAVVQSVLDWIIRRFTSRRAPAIAGVAGLISTFIALLLASLFSDGLTFDGLVAWILATLVVWIVTGLAGWLLPKWLLNDRQQPRSA